LHNGISVGITGQVHLPTMCTDVDRLFSLFQITLRLNMYNDCEPYSIENNQVINNVFEQMKNNFTRVQY